MIFFLIFKGNDTYIKDFLCYFTPTQSKTCRLSPARFPLHFNITTTQSLFQSNYKPTRLDVYKLSLVHTLLFSSQLKLKFGWLGGESWRVAKVRLNPDRDTMEQ